MANPAVATVALSTEEQSTATERDGHLTSERTDELLSAKQINDIVRTWAIVEGSRDLEDVGMKMFERLFAIAPQAVELFPKFANVPIDKLKYDDSYRGHAMSVMQAVQLAVSSVDDLDGLFSTLRDLGTVHTGLGIQDIHFLLVGQSLLWALGAAIGVKDFTPEVQEAWTKFYGIVTEKMKEGLHEANSVRYGDSHGL
ncbi:hypothetical protein EMCRGX_G032635 [Ephydatia muelleri]